MRKRQLTVIGGILGAVGVGLLSGATAHALPWTPTFTVTGPASASPNSPYTVTVTNGQNGCFLRAATGRASVTSATPISAGSGAVTFPSFGPKPGTYVVTVRTAKSGRCSVVQTGSMRVVVTSTAVTGPSSARSGSRVTIKVMGYSPNAPLQVTLTNGTGRVSSSPPLTPDDNGSVSYTFTAPPAGIWAVVVTQEDAPTQGLVLRVLG